MEKELKVRFEVENEVNQLNPLPARSPLEIQPEGCIKYVISHIKDQIQNHEMCGQYGACYMYTILVTPRGKDQKHSDYIGTLFTDLGSLTGLRMIYYVKEYTNTQHLHLLIGMSSDKYQFKKLKGKDRPYVFMGGRTISLVHTVKYMLKNEPTHKKTKIYWIYTLKHKKIIRLCDEDSKYFVKLYKYKNIIRKKKFKRISVIDL